MPIHISGYLYEWKAAIRILKLYIIPEHNQADKKRNVETLNLANAIKAQKILEIYNQTYGFNHNRLSNMKLTGYMKLIAEQSVNNRVRKSAIHAVVCHLERYTPNGILLIYHRGWLNAKCNLSFSLILADISSIYPFSEKSELAKTSEK